MLYSADYLQSGHATTCFERNQLFPGSISLSPLDVGHASDLHINTASGPPRSFRHASTCPRLDRPASGSIRVTSRTCIRRASPKMRACRFRSGFSVEQISLATHMHSLARSSKRMMQRWHSALVPTPRGVFLRAAYPLTPHRSIANRFQALCTTLFGVLFSFRSPYYCAIGLKTYLALEVGVSQIFAGIPTHDTQDMTPTFSIYVYVAITLYGMPFQATSTSFRRL